MISDAGADNVSPPPRARAALRHVATRSSGPALDPDLRITLNFQIGRAHV